MEEKFDYEKVCDLANTISDAVNELKGSCAGIPALERDVEIISSNIDIFKLSLNID